MVRKIYKLKKCRFCKYFGISWFCGYGACVCSKHGSLDCDQHERHPDTEAEKCPDFEEDLSKIHEELLFVMRLHAGYIAKFLEEHCCSTQFWKDREVGEYVDDILCRWLTAEDELINEENEK